MGGGMWMMERVRMDKVFFFRAHPRNYPILLFPLSPLPPFPPPPFPSFFLSLPPSLFEDFMTDMVCE